VRETKRGRGKGGSQLADLTSLTGGVDIQIGTPRSDDVLNVTVNGRFYGYQSEREVPANYETDAGNAVLLKEQFKGLLNAVETRPMVEIVAPTAPEVNGTFTVVNARQLRGRGGQIVLTLHNPEVGDDIDLWSYRHSGVVQTFTVVG
jgi:hypothetical protein